VINLRSLNEEPFPTKEVIRGSIDSKQNIIDSSFYKDKRSTQIVAEPDWQRGKKQKK
jgi:hypothetical protein